MTHFTSTLKSGMLVLCPIILGVGEGGIQIHFLDLMLKLRSSFTKVTINECGIRNK